MRLSPALIGTEETQKKLDDDVIKGRDVKPEFSRQPGKMRGGNVGLSHLPEPSTQAQGLLLRDTWAQILSEQVEDIPAKGDTSLAELWCCWHQPETHSKTGLWVKLSCIRKKKSLKK